MTTFRKGIAPQAIVSKPAIAADSSPPLDTSGVRIGKQLTPKAPEPKPEPPRERERPALFDARGDQIGVQPRVGLVLGARGEPVRGLQPETIKGMAEAQPGANTQCTACMLWFPTAETRTTAINPERPSYPVIICRKCAKISNRDPKAHPPEVAKSDWKPKVPEVGFTRGIDDTAGRPYNPAAEGESLGDMVNRGTYYEPGTVNVPNAPSSAGWSGGGRVGRRR